MTDRGLRQDILHALEFGPSVNAENIGVAVKDGVVTQTGFGASYAEKAVAERVVGRVKGVRAITQEIEVRFDGKVHACHEKEMVQWAAWPARGVTEVEDRIQID